MNINDITIEQIGKFAEIFEVRINGGNNVSD